MQTCLIRPRLPGSGGGEAGGASGIGGSVAATAGDELGQLGAVGADVHLKGCTGGADRVDGDAACFEQRAGKQDLRNGRGVAAG
jgi:hypothetical protein